MLKPFTWYRSLCTPKGRREESAFILEGTRAISQIAAVAPEAILEIIAAEGVEFDLPCAAPQRRLPVARFNSLVGSRTPQGVAAVVRIPADSSSTSLPARVEGNVLLCEHVQDPGNVGTLIRTAAALDFCGVILSDRCADPYAPKTVQSAAGTTLSLWIRRGAHYLDLARELGGRGHQLVATALGGDSRAFYDLRSPCVIMLGSEGSGLSEMALACAQSIVQIPMNSARAESLNVAAAGAICMHRLYTGRIAAKG